VCKPHVNDLENFNYSAHCPVTAVENYVSLNKLSQNPRAIAPITKSAQPFVGFSERDLAGFFFKRGGELKERLVELASLDGVCTSITDVHDWIGRKNLDI
jgi:hypothetical protein